MFNTNQPASQSQLDNLFMGDPNLTPDQVNSNLFTQNSQGQGWVNQQAQNLGIGDPVAHYNAILLARKMANTQSGAQAEAARQAGAFSPTSLPGQLAARDNMWNQVQGQQDQQTAGLASLQQVNNDRAYPLPTPGSTPTMSPVMQTAMAQQGITNPTQFLMQQRLGGNQGMVDTKPLANANGAINPDDLYNEPTFQAALNHDPNKASQVFSALTGQDFKSYANNYAASKNQERTSGVSFLRKSLEEGTAQLNPDGSMGWRQQVQNPTTGMMVPGPTVAAGNPFQKSMEKYLPYMDSDPSMTRFRQLAKKGAGAPVASLQNAGPANDNGAQPGFQTTGAAQGDYSNSTIGNTLAGMAGTVSDLASFSGKASDPGYFNGMMRQSAMKTSGAAPVHARAALANNPRFQALLKSNPDAARRIIMSLQQSGANQNAPAPLMQVDDNTQLYGP